MLKVVEKQDAREAGEELLRLDEIAREGARRMLLETLKAEVDDYLERHRSKLNANYVRKRLENLPSASPEPSMHECVLTHDLEERVRVTTWT